MRESSTMYVPLGLPSATSEVGDTPMPSFSAFAGKCEITSSMPGLPVLKFGHNFVLPGMLVVT